MANTMKLGINGNPIAYWSQQIAYKDVRKNSQFYHTSDSTLYDTGGDFIPGDYKTDASGSPTDYIYSAIGQNMPTGTFARAVMCRSLRGSPPYPSGTYHAFYDGSGTITLGNDAAEQGVVGPGDVSFTINTPTTAGILLDISSAPLSENAEYIRNVRIVHEDDVASYETQPFNQKMIDSLKELTDSDGGYFRSMNWSLINGDGGYVHYQSWNQDSATPTQLAWRVAASSWDDRVKPYIPAGGGLGASLEHAVQICNTIDRNLWYCVPHRATPDFITNAATYIKANLNSSLSTVVEWGNEFWNSGFYVNYYCFSGAADPTVSAQYYAGLTVTIGGVPVPAWPIGGTGNDMRALWRYAADRTTEAHDIFSSVFDAGTQREGLIRTIGVHSANQWHTERLLEWSGVNSNGPPSGSIDAISIAPYFGAGIGNVPIAPTIVSADTNASPIATLASGPWFYSSSVGEILASATHDVSASTGSVRQDVSGYRILANEYNMDLYLYEAGQHLVGIGSYQNAMYNLFSACNADPGMGTLYNIYLDMLQEEEVNVACMYRAIGKNAKTTMFGLQEYYNQEVRPKYDAVLAWLNTQPTTFLNNLGYRLDINS